MSTDLVLLHPAGRMPDTFTGVVRALPGDVTAWLPNLGLGPLAGQQQAAEEYLDRNELRRVVLAGHGTGAQVAAAIALAQPQRVSHLVLSQPQLRADDKALETQLRALRMTPKFLFRHRGMDKAELLAGLESARGLDLGESLAGSGIPTLIFEARDEGHVRGARFVAVPAGQGLWYEAEPERFVAEVGRFLAGDS